GRERDPRLIPRPALPAALIPLPEGERVGLYTGVEEHDLVRTVGDGARLTNQLIEPLVVDRAVALVVDVESASSARRLSVDEGAKPDGGSSLGRAHDEIEIACVEAVRDRPVGFVQPRGLSSHRPLTG